MPSRFEIGTLELAWTRRLLCAAEIVDAVTLEPVTQDIEVRAEGLKKKPFINWSGIHCWLEEGNAVPQRIVVEPREAPYSRAESPAPVPPNKAVRIELSPQSFYVFPPGATALRGALRVSRFGQPTPIDGASVVLQWSDGIGWVNAPTEVKTNRSGDFAAPLRLAPRDEPRLIDGKVAVRVRVRRAGSTRTSDEFTLRAGQVSPAAQPFIWDDLHP